jgi:hypothetical protein
MPSAPETCASEHKPRDPPDKYRSPNGIIHQSPGPPNRLIQICMPQTHDYMAGNTIEHFKSLFGGSISKVSHVDSVPHFGYLDMGLIQ